MGYTEEQKLMWEETNKIANSLCAISLDLRLTCKLLGITKESPEKVVQAVVRIHNCLARISECNKDLQKMITKEGE